MKAVITAIAAVAAIAAAGAASAQDYSLPSNYGDINLNWGFTPDPITVNLTAGGDIDAGYAIGGNCRGAITNAPDVQLNYSAGGMPLIISVNSSADTTLVVNAPDGRFYCDDDGGESGLNPSLRWNSPLSGAYDIWVGSYSGQAASATLSISELYTY